MEAADPVDGLALLDGFREADVPCMKRPLETGAFVQLMAVSFEHRARSRCQGRVDEDRNHRNLALIHQGREVHEQFLRALDRKRGDEKRTAGACRRPNLVTKSSLPDRRGCVLALRTPIGRLADDIIEFPRSFRIRLEQLVIGSDIAGE